MNIYTSSSDSTDVSPSSITYFSSTETSKASSPVLTPTTTPSLKSVESDPFDTCKIGSKPLPVLDRQFPAPAEEVDVKAMLERQPGRWSIQGQIEANMRRSQTAVNEEKIREKRAREFDAAKKELLASASTLSGPWRS